MLNDSPGLSEKSREPEAGRWGDGPAGASGRVGLTVCRLRDITLVNVTFAGVESYFDQS